MPTVSTKSTVQRHRPGLLTSILRRKIGGFAMRRFGFGFQDLYMPPSSEDLAKAWQPYVEAIVELFGPERCMFESNFPVDNEVCSDSTLWNAYKRIAKAYSAQDRSAMFHDTALNVFRIPAIGKE